MFSSRCVVFKSDHKKLYPIKFTKNQVVQLQAKGSLILFDFGDMLIHIFISM